MHEDLLRHIWAKQLFDTTRLFTTDGRAVRIIHIGTLHRGGGPDFRHATIAINGITYSGDIEFHRTFDDWVHHNHHIDSNYNSVILHVVLNGTAAGTPTASGRTIPTVVLEPLLISSIESIRDQLAREEYLSRSGRLRCTDTNETMDAHLMRDWILAVFQERLQEKTHRLYDRLCTIIIHQHRIIGEPRPSYFERLDPHEIPLPDSTIDAGLFRNKLPWEQLLYEQILDALGYVNNREPMRQLSETLSILDFIRIVHDDDQHRALTAFAIESIFFIASGLLPSLADVTDQESRVHIHTLNRAWNDLPKKMPLSRMQKTDWIFSPTRPSNFPTIRIAAAGILTHRILFGSLFRSLITLVGGKYSSPQSKIEQLQSLLEPGEHPFWNYHYSFTEPTQKKHALLGESRKNDIIVNVVVPFVCLYAKVFGDNDLLDHCLSVAVEMPLLEENAILRTMEKQLIKKRIPINNAYQQQGLLQLNKRYCRLDRCGECEIGKKVFR